MYELGVKRRTQLQAASAMFEVTRSGELPKKHRRTERWFIQDLGLSGAAVAEIFLMNLTESEKSEVVDLVMRYGMMRAYDKVVDLITKIKFGVTASPAMYDRVQQILPRKWHKWEVSSRAGMWAAIRRVIKQGKEETFHAMTGASFMVSELYD